MPSQEEIEQQHQLLATHRRTLAHLLKQAAQYGGEIFAPPHTANGISEARENIRHVKEILRNWGVAVIDHPDELTHIRDHSLDGVLPLNRRNNLLGRKRIVRENSGSSKAKLLTSTREPADTINQLHVTIESAHSGESYEILVPLKASVKWLTSQAIRLMNVKESIDIGSITPFRIRWVLVDIKVENVWNDLPMSEQLKVKAVVHSDGENIFSLSDYDRIGDIKGYDGIVFHLYAIEEISNRSGGGARRHRWL
jgi:hypothetical protein